MTILKSLIVLIVGLTSINILSAGTQTVLYDFVAGNDGAYPQDYGRLARDTAGNLFGTTQFGGVCGEGTIFELKPKGNGSWTESVLYAFCGGSDGSIPFSDVILDKHGNIYGTTSGTGNGTCGTVFELSGTTLNTLHAFTCDLDGGHPITGLIRDNRGNLYGTTPDGGATGWGVVYEISRAGTFSVLYNFCQLAGCADGGHPSAGLARDSAGNLYGTTLNGGDPNCVFGTPGCGLVFELSKVADEWTETVLHTFTGKGKDGANPLYASLTLASQKINNMKVLVIYGVTSAGGDSPDGTDGTVFQMIQLGNGFSFNVLHSFGCCFSDGTAPVGTLTLAKGRLFGTTPIGGSSDSGTVFELSKKKNQWTETILYNFVNGIDGGHPYSGVVVDPNGVLYGVASSDGGSFGAVYQVTP